MPHVINGIGTWYYGKRNLHRLRGVCSQCGAAGDLQSYDTSLYFVVVFVPLVPLAHKRILDSCPACSMHRAVPLKEWQRAKDEAITGVLDKLRADPNDRNTVLTALGLAASFQDEKLFDKLSESLAADRTDDAAIQAALGDCNGYFARHREAVTAYQHSLRAEDSPHVREQLGLSLLRLGDPEQAAGCFAHVLDDGDENRLWLLYQLTTAYQAKGLHPEALELLDRVNERFPATAGQKDWEKLRKVSVKDRGRGRPAGTYALLESRKAGTREGSRLGSLLPKLVLPLLVLGFAGWHTWRSVTLAAARPVMLVNGSPKAYTVAVNGTPYQLPAGGTKRIEVPEGTVSLTPGAGADGIEPTEVRFASTFWARPYDGTGIVLNPDRLAVLIRETTVYADNPPPPGPDQFFAGKPLHELESVNHFFEPFPGTVKAKRGRTVTRTRAGLLPVTGSESRAGAVAAAGLSPADQLEYGKRWVALDPDDMLALAWFAGLAPPATTLPVYKTRLADRPVRVDWHRAYQTVAERAGEPQEGLRDEYRKLAAETGRDPDVLYLLARVSDKAEADRLLREAIESGKPAARAHYALGYRLLSQGEFKGAAAEMDKAEPLVRGPAYSTAARDALLAAGRYRDLLERLGADGPRLPSLVERAKVAELAGDPTEADSAANAASMQLSGPAASSLRTMVQSAVAATRAAAKGDTAGYLAATAAAPGGTVQDALLRDDLTAAEAAAGTAPPTEAASGRGLVLLATPPTDAAKLAAAKRAFLDALGAGDRDHRELKAVLEAGTGDVVTAVREGIIAPGDKRVYAAAAAVWFPAQRAELVALAHQMDYHRDGVSLALRKLTGGEPVKPAGKKPGRPPRRGGKAG